MAGNAANALALVKYAHEQSSAAAPILKKVAAEKAEAAEPASSSSLQSIYVSADDAQFLLDLLQAELLRARALVDIEKHQPQPSASAKTSTLALSETLGDYPAGAVDLDNIVTYPPRIEAMPIKPIFLDIAWNYIDYPTKAGAAGSGATVQPAAAQAEAADSSAAEQPQKRGWFGFTR